MHHFVERRSKSGFKGDHDSEFTLVQTAVIVPGWCTVNEMRNVRISNQFDEVFEFVGLVNLFVFAPPLDSWETQCDAAFVTCRPGDTFECYLEYQ